MLYCGNRRANDEAAAGDASRTHELAQREQRTQAVFVDGESHNGRGLPMQCKRWIHSRLRRRRKALPITDTELKLMARAAISGDSSQPVSGYSTPAAIGIPSAL